MLWTASWPPSSTVPTVLVICAVIAWWFTEPKSAHLNLIVVIGCLLFFWAVAPDLAQDSPLYLYDALSHVATTLRLDVLVHYHANMLVTGAAVLWIAHRAWQTLWKPVPELIGILGVDVPDAPDVSLAGIRADAATLNWTRPRPNRPVSKFLIQVNGVNVGESANQETAITVTGLKPNHFYNVRVIAVGYNNFQAGSRVIRLRTFGSDGRPQLGDDRLPSNFVPEEQQLAMPAEHVDEDGTPRTPAAGVEAVSIPDQPLTPMRESSSSISLARRNTLTRKHSPSTTSIDQTVKDALGSLPESSLQELGDKFQRIRKEIDETQAQISKDEKEHKEAVDELTEEKKQKRRLLKEKDDTTEKLKREMGSTDRSMRTAQSRKTQKEKNLREKQNERKKLEDDMAKWDKDMASMNKRQTCFEEDKKKIQQEGDVKAEELRNDISLLQASYAQEEAELKEKSKDLKDAEEQRKKLPGGEESEDWRNEDREIRRQWEIRARELQRQLFATNRKLRMVTDYEHALQAQLAAVQQSGLPFMYDAAAAEFDMQPALKHDGHPNESMPNLPVPSPPADNFPAENFAPDNFPADNFPAMEQPSQTFTGFPPPSRAPTIPPGFAPGPFMDHSADFSLPLDDEGMRALTGGAPLSPTAASLLPSGMLDLLDDDEQAMVRFRTSPENNPQSPASSGHSQSIVSSPQESARNLPYAGENSGRRSTKGSRGEQDATPSPIAPQNHGGRRSFLPWLHRNSKPDEEPPALGTLKPGQSQSFPRQVDDPSPSKRRISFSNGWNMFHRNSAGPDLPEPAAVSPRAVASRRMGMANGSQNASGIFADREPSGSPRAMSIASNDRPRPSTDSGSIWGRPQPSQMWPSEDPWASRTVSRRASLRGSPSALKTTLADADDEILDDSELFHAPASHVGVIGTKPSSAAARSLSQRLNPAAPSFMGGFFRPRTEKEKDAKDKAKAKGKEHVRKSSQSLGSLVEVASPMIDDSPTDSRKSRDALSVDTPSVAESGDSLILDRSLSDVPSELALGLGIKDESSSIKKLLRKGSSSKFSLSSVRGLGAKKGPGSVTSSDRNLSVDRSSLDETAEDDLLGRSFDSTHGSPSVGSIASGGNKTPKDRSSSGWGARFGMKKKQPQPQLLQTGREQDSLDMDRSDVSTAATSPGGAGSINEN